MKILAFIGIGICLALMAASFGFCRYCDKWHTRCRCKPLNPEKDARSLGETWTCHICGKEREDQNISVLTYLLKDLPGAERNIRYCNDNPDCRKGAEEKANTGTI